MALNPYVNFRRSNEQDTIERLIIESIKFFGVNVTYLPRTTQNLDQIYGEDVLSLFTDKFDIEMYFKSIDTLGNDTVFLSKFGIEVKDSATFTVARQSFLTEAGGLIEHPREGDLLFLDWDDDKSKQLYEIKFVEKNAVFYQLGKLYTYDLKVELFHYSHEKFDPIDTDIDSIINSIVFSINLQLGTGSGTYAKDEVIYQGQVGSETAQATVISFDSTTKILEVKDIIGEFELTLDDSSLYIRGTAGTYALTAFDIQGLPNDPIADNSTVETISTDIIVDDSNPIRRR